MHSSLNQVKGALDEIDEDDETDETSLPVRGNAIASTVWQHCLTPELELAVISHDLVLFVTGITPAFSVVTGILSKPAACSANIIRKLAPAGGGLD